MTDLWIGPDALLLASTSATRRTLLEQAGLPVDTQSPDIDERAVESACGSVSPVQLATRLAVEKALAVSRRSPDRLVLGADQVLSCEGRLFHKPANLLDAHSQLLALQGRAHTLQSAGCLARNGAVVESFVDEARLTMRPLNEDAVGLYLAAAGCEALSGVGCYQVEHRGIHLFEKVDGNHATILGLSLLALLAALRRLGRLAF